MWERTVREARTAARLAHPGVVRAYDVLFSDGRPWIVMEDVTGRSLEEAVDADGPLGVRETIAVGLAVLGALEAAAGPQRAPEAGRRGRGGAAGRRRGRGGLRGAPATTGADGADGAAGADRNRKRTSTCDSPQRSSRSPHAQHIHGSAGGMDFHCPDKSADTNHNGPVLPAADPTKVSIPKLGVTSALMQLGTDGSGAMEVPPDAGTVGWFTGAPAPGSLGPAVLSGHVDWKGTRGAFARLTDLTAGDEIDVERADGRRAAFVVTAVERHPKDALPTQAVYGPIDHAGLRLITCGGEFDRSTGHYRDNVVVFAGLRA